MADIKETKEAIKAVVLVGKFVVDRAKDGVGLDDLSALITKIVLDPQFKAILDAGVQGVDKVPAELSDLDFAEVIELASLVPEILKVIKG
jgi:hypothetical protein